MLLRGYRAVISPLYGDVCRYYPSCSAYTLQAIQARGLIVGSALGLWRIARCHPWAEGGIDDVPQGRDRGYRLTQFGFVVAGQGKG
ncbi:membrane protein insertion efficiency factor YidD [Rathayibacter sp. YIM 133350]|uniref:membrane protein insertion efficiency factor YidD n=1 Tax=Rathayibacter sp. YIM 133350 TaxID=3131992 RepID=UPI00307EB181